MAVDRYIGHKASLNARVAHRGHEAMPVRHIKVLIARFVYKTDLVQWQISMYENCAT